MRHRAKLLSVKPLLRYGDFSICDECVWTTNEGHLVVFIIVQNLVGIDAVLLIICICFFDFTSLARKYLFTPSQNWILGKFDPLNFKAYQRTKPPKGSPLGQTSNDVQIVKIGLPVRPVRVTMRPKKETRMWVDAQRDGRPAEYRWRCVRKFRNSIPCTTPQTLADPAAGVPCNNAANIGEGKTWTQSEFCTWRNSVREQEPPKMYT